MKREDYGVAIDTPSFARVGGIGDCDLQDESSWNGGVQNKLSRFTALEQKTIKAVIEQIVANVFQVSIHQLNTTSRNVASVAFARQTAMYLTHVVCGLNFTEVGLLFKRDRTTVSHACKCVEDRRDDFSFDHSLGFLETATALMIGQVLHQKEKIK